MPPTKEIHQAKTKRDSFYSPANVEHLRRSIAQAEIELSPEILEAITKSVNGQLSESTVGR